jgi:hypothetical protein
MIPQERLNRYAIRILQKDSLFLLIAVAFAAFPGKMIGQASAGFSPVNERVYVHLDKQVYVAGESIKYKVYFLNGASDQGAPCSKILYFSLMDASGRSRADWRINLGARSVSGCYTIPADINPGMYYLRVYTNLMRNGPADRICSQNLLILNLSKAIPDTVMSCLSGCSVAQPGTKDLTGGSVLIVRTSKEAYSAGETVRLEIDPGSMQQLDTSADLSVSVSLVTPLEKLIPEADMAACLESTANKSKAEVPCRYRLENKGFILAGQIKNRFTLTSLAHENMLLSVIDSIAPRILYTQTDSIGAFHFYLSNLYDNKDLILQLVENSRNADYLWDIDRKVPAIHQDTLTPYVWQMEETAFLNTVKDLSLIEAVYEKETSRVFPANNIGETNYFMSADVIVYPADYSDLVNFKEITDNIIPCVKFMKRNDVFSLQIMSEKSGLYRESNMVLLNGVPFTDMNYIATLGTKEIRRIEVITRNYLLGDLTLPGLVSVYTNDNRIPENYIKSSTYFYRNVVVPNDTGKVHAAENKAEEHFPDFRSTLYWNPQISISGKESLVFEFPASRLKGIFSVKVRGIVGQSHPVSNDTFFEVK